MIGAECVWTKLKGLFSLIMTKYPLYYTHFVMCDGDHYAPLIIHTETYKILCVNYTRLSPSITGPGNIKPDCWTKAKK